MNKVSFVDLGKLLRIFSVFLTLGCLAFGGPLAHISFFQQHLVQERAWISATKFRHYLLLAQCLPGPSSSQLGFLIGREYGGLLGAILAFIGFILPSFVMMTMFAVTGQHFWGAPWLQSILSSLQLCVIVVVANAVYDLFRQFCTNLFSLCLCLCTTAFLILTAGQSLQWLALLTCLIISFLYTKIKQLEIKPLEQHNQQSIAKLPLALWFLLAILCLWLPLIKPFAGIFWSGSSVFGGGHVVLPFLLETYQHQLPLPHLTAGYALVQLMPGPLLSIGAFIGASLMPTHFLLGAILGCLLMFIPGFLFVLAILPIWERWVNSDFLQFFLVGIGASVCGILFATLYTPLITQTVTTYTQAATILIGILALRIFKIPFIWIACTFIVLGYYSN